MVNNTSINNTDTNVILDNHNDNYTATTATTNKHTTTTTNKHTTTTTTNH